MAAKDINKSISDKLTELDTGQWSILHYVFTRPPIQKTTFLKSYFVPYIVTVVLCYGLPLIVILLKTPDILLSVSIREFGRGFLQDWNLLFSYCVTMPAFVIFTINERTMIPERLARLAQTGVIPIAQLSDNSTNLWLKRYKITNIVGQLVSLVVAIILCLLNYKLISAPDYAGWQFRQEHLGIAGWIYVGWQLPCFFWIISFYIFRGLTTTIFLFSICRNSEIKVVPFHHDNCCGLKPVGYFGLRNQYLLALAGVNLLVLWYQLSVLGTESIYATSLLIAGAIAYVTFGPIVFMGPLLPFRKSMLSAKEKEQETVAARLQDEYARIMKELEQRSMSEEDGDLIDRLQKLKSLVDQIPVWPFDTITLRKFFAAYISPLLTVLISLLINYLIKVLGVAFASGGAANK